MSRWRASRAVLLLPCTVTIVVPAAILWWTGETCVGWGLGGAVAAPPVLIGMALLAVGLVLLVSTIWLFSRVGEGTLAPWDPTAKLVVHGPYRHVRNPMISGVAFVLAGEAALLGSKAIGLWFAAVVAVNAIYIPLVEEPGLRRRFGAAYDEYAANVPRWLPRVRPWSA
jgi:protein-S-isoprenylcysteine O-methyltransferase Ste14